MSRQHTENLHSTPHPGHPLSAKFIYSKASVGKSNKDFSRPATPAWPAGLPAVDKRDSVGSNNDRHGLLSFLKGQPREQEVDW